MLHFGETHTAACKIGKRTGGEKENGWVARGNAVSFFPFSVTRENSRKAKPPLFHLSLSLLPHLCILGRRKEKAEMSSYSVFFIDSCNESSYFFLPFFLFPPWQGRQSPPLPSVLAWVNCHSVPPPTGVKFGLLSPPPQQTVRQTVSPPFLSLCFSPRGNRRPPPN